MKQFDTIARWDKLKSWRVLSDEIEDKLKAAEKSDHGMTLDIGPQLLYTLRHPSSLKCMHHSSSKLGELFTCHYNKGAVQGVRVWLVETKDKEGACKNKGFEIDCEILCMTYVSKHRVYLVFSSDLTLRVFTDARSNFVEIDRVTCMATILCLIYNKWEDEVYAGGVGFIEEWKVLGAEHAASVVPGKKFFTDLTINDWIRNIKILKENNHIIAQHGNGLCVINFKTRKQMHRLPNRHDGPLTCCCYYPPNDFLITGGSDGKIRVFNGTAFNLLHAFIGHNGLISDIQPQIKDALLFSSSHDGTVRIWRVDSMQLFMSLDIGEKVYHMALLSNTEFYFYTEKNIMIYSCHQFYEFFAPVESETKRLMCCRAKDRPSRILASTEDGSVRLFSPITGLTLTIIYPMPSFQVLMSFAYDIHQEKLHTVLTGGKVIVYNTATNPCKAVELWVPKTEDEHVNILLLVTVEFPCEDGTDVDNLVFAGLKNGQILLCDAVVCSMEDPVQAHEGSVVCLQNCLHSPDTGHFGSSETVGVIISGGTDKYVKIWKLQIISDDRRPIINLCPVLKIYLPSVPLHISMYSTNVWVATQTVSKKGHNSCKLVMYKLIQMGSSKTMASKQLLQKKFVLIAHQVTHHEDEDHTGELTSLDLCPLMNVVMTSGKDGFVKVWSNQNELIREMNFATPIYASCFANERGDILVGFGTHICSVSLVNYLPLDYLKEVCSVSNFYTEDDVRELPVKFDHSSEPWLDICNLAHYSVDIVQRRRQRLEEEVIDKFKKATKKESAKFVIFVDGKTTRVIRKDFADRLLVWAKGKQKLKFGVKTVDTASLSTDISSNVKRKAADNVSQKKKNDALRKLSRTGSSVKERKKKYFDSGGVLEIYPSAVGKALKELNQQKRLGAEEMRLLKEQELLKRDPIIAPDGFIPNSVIRKKLKSHGAKIDDALRKERPFQLKPVPKANPQHMPAWWAYEEEDKEQSTTYTWDSTSSEGLSRSKPTSGQRSYTNLSESSTLKAGKTKPGTPTAYKIKSKRIELSRLDYDSRTSGRRSGAQSEAREKSFKLTNYAVDEDSSAIHVKESKSGRRLKSHMSHVIIQQLLQEEWMPEIGGDFELGDIINILVKVLSDQNNSDVYDKACTYVTNMFHELGLTEEQMDQIIGKLGVNLDNGNTAIKKFTLQTLQNIGLGRNDVLMLILPKLVDQDESIRGAAIEAIRVLTGAHDKETLLNFLESVGITSAEYRSREDQEYTLAMLAERFGEHEDPEVFHRIQNWVADTTPGLFDEDRDDDELWQDSRSRKEHSIMSEGKSGKKDGPLTPRSKGAASTFRKRMKETDGFSTISDRSSSSRKSCRSGRFTPRDPKLYKYYDSKQDAGSDKQELKETESQSSHGRIQNKDSGFNAISDIKSSPITDRLSGYSSGIAKDMSEFSHGRPIGKGHQHAPLSPVKSEPGSPPPHLQLYSPKDWRKFFDMIPNAQERRQMEQIRREMEQGKLRHSTLPPISYFAEDLPMLPGEAGTRLLKTVRVGEKMQVPGDGRHRIESVPGKLAVHTQNEDAGLSNYGILQMQWTTGVPTVKDRVHPPQRIAQHRTHKMIRPDSSDLDPHGLPHRMRRGISEEELHLPYLDSASPHVANLDSRDHYEWEFPLPPPPAKESRTEIPQIRKEHDTYCKYYHLVKKKLHLYTSHQKERTQHLPELFVKRIRDEEEQPTSGKNVKKKSSLTNTDFMSSVIFPPLKLRQLVNIY